MMSIHHPLACPAFLIDSFTEQVENILLFLETVIWTPIALLMLYVVDNYLL
jgi:hypothetical protein